MINSAALMERKALLARKLGSIERLIGHLGYSRARLPYPLASIDNLDEAALESVSALVERFGKLQDLLGNVFREILVLSGEDATDMNEVLGHLEKIGILDSADDWRALRSLRNLGAHDYDEEDAGKSAFINEIAVQSAQLVGIAERVIIYCREKLTVGIVGI
jgi:hypothetical protein